MITKNWALTNFVTITENSLQTDTIRIGKRLNNPKRDFLFINEHLGKHIAANAQDIHVQQTMLFEKICKQAKTEQWCNEKLLIVGFAETATALAESIAHKAMLDNTLNAVAYVQTTRENIETTIPAICFEEEHSHATSQKLYLDNTISFDRVLFIEDEISTGTTILNFIKAFEEKGITANYSVASILNWQNKENQDKFKAKNINTIALIFGELKETVPTLPKNKTILENNCFKEPWPTYTPDVLTHKTPRTPMIKDEFLDYLKIDQKIIDNIQTKMKKEHIQPENVLIIGSEEYMYKPFLIAKALNTRFKATTRSPIEIGGPIKSRLKLNSVYDSNRTTYLYNLKEDQPKLILFIPEVYSQKPMDALKLECQTLSQAKTSHLELEGNINYLNLY